MEKKKLLLFLLFSFGYLTCFSQEEHEENPEKKHAILFFLGHAHITEGVRTDGKRVVLSVPAWGLDYNYELTEKWAIGLHSDIILENFLVENLSDENVIERSHPIASAFVASYKPGKHFSFLSGFGGEYDKEESFFLIRLGVEYGVDISEDWEFVANIINDLKPSAYNSIGIGVGIARKF
jgi:hypothetical protein